MIANYHTHTVRCNHARGSEREYVEKAIRSGLQILGFSDHTPYPFPDGHVSGFRMLPDQLEDYVNTVLALKKEYKDQITIHLGLEAEYYPAFFDRLLELIRPYPIEYLILGQHFIGNEINAEYSGGEPHSAEVFTAYCEQVQTAMKTGKFTYFAHPDLIYFLKEERKQVPFPDRFLKNSAGREDDLLLYQEGMRQVCRTAKACNIPLEINLLGLKDRRNYPNPLFWKIAGEEGCSAVIGCDAHSPEDIYREDVIREGQKLAADCNLKLLDTVPLIAPCTDRNR